MQTGKQGECPHFVGGGGAREGKQKEAAGKIDSITTADFKEGGLKKSPSVGVPQPHSSQGFGKQPTVIPKHLP